MPIWGWVMIGVALAVSFVVDFNNTAQGGAIDLRNRITGLRLLALSKGRILPAESMGKHKTVWQIITVVFFLGVLSFREIRHEGPLAHGWYYADLSGYAGVALIICTLGFTLYSGFGYLWKNRELLQTQ